MANKIAFFHEKGGVRKSSIAVPYAKYRNIPYYTNDRHYMLAQRLLSKKSIHLLEGELEEPKKAVFDLAGASDRELIKNIFPIIDLWVIPLSPSLMDYIPLLEVIRDIFEGKRAKFVFIITGADKKDCIELKEVLKKDFPQSEVFLIGNSKYVMNMLADKKSILDYENEKGLAKYQTKKIREQYIEAFKYFDKE